jgi:hypothetical protein
MAKWREESGKTISGSDENSGGAGKEDPATGTGRRQPGHRAREGQRTGLRRVTDTAANVVRVVAMIICVLLALHIAFVVFSANPANPIVRTVNDRAQGFAWEFRDIFTPKDERVAVLVNYGIAAVVYLIAGRVAAGLIRRIR